MFAYACATQPHSAKYAREKPAKNSTSVLQLSVRTFNDEISHFGSRTPFDREHRINLNEAKVISTKL